MQPRAIAGTLLDRGMLLIEREKRIGRRCGSVRRPDRSRDSEVNIDGEMGIDSSSGAVVCDR